MHGLASHFAVAFLIVVAGCSSSEATPSGDPGTAGDSRGPDAGDSIDADLAGDGEVVPPGFARLTGRAVQTSNKTKGVPATVTAGTETATSDATGSWSIMLPTAQPFSLVFTADGYATLTEESATLTGNYESGARPLIDRSIGQLLVGALPSFDSTLGMLAINVVAEPSCANEDGATLTVTAGNKKTGGGAPGDPQLVYFVGGLPTPAATSAAKGMTPAAIAYNLPLGEVTVIAQHPSCAPVVPPVTQGPITYHGTVEVVAAGTASSLALSFLRAFLD